MIEFILKCANTLLLNFAFSQTASWWERTLFLMLCYYVINLKLRSWINFMTADWEAENPRNFIHSWWGILDGSDVLCTEFFQIFKTYTLAEHNEFHPILRFQLEDHISAVIAITMVCPVLIVRVMHVEQPL